MVLLQKCSIKRMIDPQASADMFFSCFWYAGMRMNY